MYVVIDGGFRPLATRPTLLDDKSINFLRFNETVTVQYAPNHPIKIGLHINSPQEYQNCQGECYVTHTQFHSGSYQGSSPLLHPQSKEPVGTINFSIQKI